MKKNKALLILIILLIILSLIIGCIVFLNIKKLEVVLNDNMKVNMNEKIYHKDCIKSLKNGEVVVNKEAIDTSKVGEQTINIHIKDFFNRDNIFECKIEVVDNELPKITYEDIITATVGTKIDLLENVTATDNSGEKLTVKVEGEYDFDKIGEYTLYYIAEDSSGNVAKEVFTLIVKAKQSNSYSYTAPLLDPMKDKTFTTKKGFDAEIKDGILYIDGILIANKTYYLPSTYNPGLDNDVKKAADKMFLAAKKEGYDLYIASGFRSYDTQKGLYNMYVKRDGQNAADTYSARPGHSEHQSGLAFDVCDNNLSYSYCIDSSYANTDSAKWLSNNAYKYGFILRFPKNKTNETGYIYEAWHFRYVGEDLAKELYNDNDWITLENYFGITSTYNY